MQNGHSNQQPEGLDIKQQLLQKKIAAFNEDLAKLQDKHGLVIVPILNTNTFGIIPDMIYMPKEEFEARTGVKSKEKEIAKAKPTS